MRVTSAGTSLEATLMSPCAPMPMAASARLSSPEKILKPLGRAVHELRDLRQLAAGFLDGLDVGRGPGQADDGLGLQVGGGAAGHVVEAHGQRIDRLGQRQEMLELAFLGGLVVVGIGGEHRAQALDDLRRSNRPGGPARAWSCGCIRPTPARAPPPPRARCGWRAATRLLRAWRLRRSIRRRRGSRCPTRFASSPAPTAPGRQSIRPPGKA